MTSILFLGDLNSHTRSAQRLRTLRSMGYHVTGLSFQRLSSARPEGPPPTLWSRVAHRLHRPLDPERINSRLIELVQRRPYDLVWIEKAPMLRTSTLARLTRFAPRTRLVAFYEDDMFARHNQSAWFRSSLEHYDLVATTKSFNARPEELSALGARAVHYVAKSFDPHLHRPVPPLPDDREVLGARVGFVGTFAAERAGDLLYLAQHGIGVRVWGNGWKRAPRHPLLAIEGRALLGEEYVRALCATDINLGFLRKENRDQHTDRSVEIPACGAFLLAERSREQQELFAEGLEADYFGSRAELLEKLHHWLRHAEQRQRVASAGHMRAVASDYTHRAALTSILERLDRELLQELVLVPQTSRRTALARVA